MSDIDKIDYNILTEVALKKMIGDILKDVAANGLPGEHHFYINFQTRYPGVVMANSLLSQYPENMTIVIQHQYRDLEIYDKSFAICLSFGGVNQRLEVPFDAINTFADPHASFGLQFVVEMPEDSDKDNGIGQEKPADIASFPNLEKAEKKENKGESIKGGFSEKKQSDTDYTQSDKETDESSSDENEEAGKVVALDAFRKKAP